MGNAAAISDQNGAAGGHTLQGIALPGAQRRQPAQMIVTVELHKLPRVRQHKLDGALVHRLAHTVEIQR